MHIPPEPPSRFLRVLLIASQPECSVLRTALLETGHELVAALPADLIVVDAPTNVGIALGQLESVLSGQRCPIVLRTQDQSSASMALAFAAGVSAYSVGGAEPWFSQTLIKLAMARFEHEQKLHADRDNARRQLAERKVIDRAKGVLMDSGRLSEEQAYQKLRAMAMNKNMKLAELAQRILDVQDLLG